jgi:hypothetical protein
MFTPDVIISPLLSVAKLVEYWSKYSFAKDEAQLYQVISRHISSTIAYVRSSRNRHSKCLTEDLKKRVDEALRDTAQALEKLEAIVNYQDGNLGRVDRLAWILGGRDEAAIYRNMVEPLHNTLLSLSIELALVKETSPEHRVADSRQLESELCADLRGRYERNILRNRVAEAELRWPEPLSVEPNSNGSTSTTHTQTDRHLTNPSLNRGAL